MQREKIDDGDTADAMEQIFKQTCRKVSARWILDADIAGFFDNINHQWMVDHVCIDKSILRKWLKCGVIDRGQWQATSVGSGYQPGVGQLDAERFGNATRRPSTGEVGHRQTGKAQSRCNAVCR